jgi:uncharacterized membrane protein YfcA
MSPAALLALGCVGLLGGFFSGLIGIGGGVLIGPFLYFFYSHPSFSGVQLAPGLEVPVAHATSLFIVIPTAVLGMINYSRARLVAWKAALPIGAVSPVAAAVGARLAVALPAELLKLGFGFFLIATGIQLSGRKLSTGDRPLRLGPAITVTTGVLLGLISSLLGVGGGLVAIPMLLYLVRLDVQKVAATSLAVVSFAAASGTISYVISGWNDPAVPPGSVGYVHVVAALPILVGSTMAVGLGVKTNQKVRRRVLRLVFGVLFTGLGLYMVIQSSGRLT